MIFVCSKLLRDWEILPLIGRILSIISPFFIGILIAWLVDPMVKALQKRGVHRRHHRAHRRGSGRQTQCPRRGRGSDGGGEHEYRVSVFVRTHKS